MWYVFILMLIILLHLIYTSYRFVNKAKTVSIEEYEKRCDNKTNYQILSDYKEIVNNNKIKNINDLHKKTLELISKA